jgi:hypothetical protein
MPLSTRRAPPHALRRSGLFGSNGLNPFIVGEFIPHDSSLPLGSLQHDPAAGLNSERLYPTEAKSRSRQRRGRRSAIRGQPGKHMLASRFTPFVKVFGCRPFIDHCCPPRQGRRSKTSKEGNRESEGRRRRATYGDLRVAGVCCRAVGMTIKDDFEG